MWRDFWALAKPFWTSEERKKAISLAIVACVLALSISAVLTQITAAGGVYGDALQDKNLKAFIKGVEKWFFWVIVFIPVTVYATYYQQLLGIRWRQWMTRRFIDAWISKRTYYYWQFAHDSTDNPDQRISEDVRDFVNYTLNLSLDLLTRLTMLVTYFVILWKLSAGMSIPIGHRLVAIPGYLDWAAVTWAVVFSLITQLIGRKLVDRNAAQQRFEADFRFGLVRIREAGESIALSGGESAERRTLTERFQNVVHNYEVIMRLNKGVNAINSFSRDIGGNLDLFLSAPLYFRGLLKLGGIFQVGNAFGYVQGGLTWFITNYSDVALLRAIIRRLTEFENTASEAKQILAAQSLTGKEVAELDSVTVSNLTLSLPDGKQLSSNVNLTLAPGDALLVSGPSGVGKSTLIRAIAGIWPYADGTIHLPADFNSDSGLIVLPQKPYLPVGRLRAALAYPIDPTTLTTTNWADLLRKLRLDHLLARLDDEENWSQILSGGEQQRVAFARVFLRRPKWLFLDEATSALDEPTEAAIYGAIRAELPETAILSIGHRSSLGPLHTRQMVLGDRSSEEISIDATGNAGIAPVVTAEG